MRTIERCVLLGLAAAAAGTGAPVLVRAQDSRQQAEKTACMTNLKQLSTGMLMYCQDYDERYAPAAGWGTVVMPYVKNRQVYRCPTDANSWSYAMNRNLDGALLRQVTRPASICLFFESNLHRANASGLAPDAVPNRHLGSSNWAFADGHVQWTSTVPAFGPIAKAPPPRPRKR